MGVAAAIDITPEERQTVLALLQRHLPGTAAWVYGSRAKWTSTPTSDLDLVVFATPEQRPQVGDLREALEESNLPFRVDLFVWDDVPESFRRSIEADKAPLVGQQAGDGRTVRVAATGRRDPDGWRIRRFAELLDGPVRNGIYKSKEHHGNGVKIVNMGELFAHPRLRAVPMRRVRLSESETDRFSLTRGDLLFARRSLVAEGAGKCSVVLDVDEPTAFESSIIRARPAAATSDPLYLYYFFSSPPGLHRLDTIRRQVAVAGITGRDLSGLEILAPPLSEQRAIAHVLGTLDDKIELNHQMSATLEAMARALFRSWFVDFDPVRAKMADRDTGLPKEIADLFPDRLVDSGLGDAPDGWRASTLADVARLNPESWSNHNAPDRVLYVDLAKTKWGEIDEIQEHCWADAPSRARRVLRRGDTIVGTVRPGNRSFALIDRDDLTGSTGFAVLRPMDPITREIVWCAATSHDAIDRLAHLADGGAYPAVKPMAVLDTPIVLPDPGIRMMFSSLTAPLLDRLQANQREARILGTLRDGLLPKLVSGELRVRDAERLVGAIT